MHIKIFVVSLSNFNEIEIWRSLPTKPSDGNKGFKEFVNCNVWFNRSELFRFCCGAHKTTKTHYGTHVRTKIGTIYKKYRKYRPYKTTRKMRDAVKCHHSLPEHTYTNVYTETDIGK